MNLLKKYFDSLVVLIILVTVLMAFSTHSKLIKAGDTDTKSPGTMGEMVSGGEVGWSDVNSSKVSDDVYTTSNFYSGYTSYLRASNFGFTIPNGSTIDGIEVKIERHANIADVNGNVIDEQAKIVKADGTIGTENKADIVNYWPLADEYKTYGASDDLWSEEWTTEDINDADFGVVLEAKLFYATCLNGDTLISTAENDVKIKDLKIGDEVISYNEETGKLESKKVINVNSSPISNSNNTYFYIYYNQGQVIKATGDHLFYVDGGYIEAKDLKVGDKLLSKDGLNYDIEKIETVINTDDLVWELSVEDNNNFFANNILVHNEDLIAYVDHIQITVYYTDPGATPTPAPTSDYWTTGTAGGTARKNHSSIIYEGKIYSWGGSDNDGYLNAIDIYDISNDEWTTGTAGGTARESHSSVIYGGKIYSWGGYNEGYLNTLDIYDIANDEWTEGTAGGTARYSHFSIIHEGKIYSWGGYNEGYLNTVDIYDIAEDSWTTGTAGGTERYGYSSVIHEGKIYSWGGENSGGLLDTLDIYDIAEDSWTTGTAGGTERYGYSSIIYDDKIYSWGGRTCDLEENCTYLNTLDIYDIANDEWTTGTAGGTARMYSSSITYGGKIYSWGGEDANEIILDTLDIYVIETIGSTPAQAPSSSSTNQSSGDSSIQIPGTLSGVFTNIVAMPINDSNTGGQGVITIISPQTFFFNAYLSANEINPSRLVQALTESSNTEGSTSKPNFIYTGGGEGTLIGVTFKGITSWQVGNIQDVWYKGYPAPNSEPAKILQDTQLKPSIIALNYKENDLIPPGQPTTKFTELKLKLAHSLDGKTWTILTSVVDPISNTVATIGKVGGYYMIVGGY